MNDADLVWNRAAMEDGGSSPRSGDRALAALMHFHNVTMNGGVHHALECLDPKEIEAAADGYAFSAFDDVAAFLYGWVENPMLAAWTDESESWANQRYAAMAPEDAIDRRFQEFFVREPGLFAPLDDGPH